jgi:hypothetical protein
MKPAPPPDMEGCVLISNNIDPDCHCQEEEWHTPIGAAFIHLKPSGEGDVFFDNGDAGEWEIEIQGDGESDFRQKFIDYIAHIESLPVLDV